MFYNIKINIAIFYIVTCVLYIFLFWYLQSSLQLGVLLSIAITGILVLFSAFMMAKLATAPLIEYINHLKALSSQTLHELNLPIATIKTNVSMIKRSTQDEKLHKRLKRIEDATQMLAQRYDELDHLIKTQTMKRIVEEFDIAQLIEERIAFLKNIYPSNEFIIDAQRKILRNDPVGLAKVIDNLIDNSVKYSPKKSKITITFKDDTLRISDEGKGIDEVELIRIFDSYYQGDSNSKGFGIGLSMVKSFCDGNDIELAIHSKVNQGTTVELKFKE